MLAGHLQLDLDVAAPRSNAASRHHRNRELPARASCPAHEALRAVPNVTALALARQLDVRAEHPHLGRRRELGEGLLELRQAARRSRGGRARRS